MVGKPIGREPRDPFESSGLLEEVGGVRDDLDLVRVADIGRNP